MCVSSRRQCIVVRSLHARTSDNNNINKPPFIPVAEVPSYRPTDRHIHYSFVYYTHTHTHSFSLYIQCYYRYYYYYTASVCTRYVAKVLALIYNIYIYVRVFATAARMSLETGAAEKCRMRHPRLAIAGACSNRSVCNKFNNYSVHILYDARTNPIRKMHFIETVIISLCS